MPSRRLYGSACVMRGIARCSRHPIRVRGWSSSSLNAIRCTAKSPITCSHPTAMRSCGLCVCSKPVAWKCEAMATTQQVVLGERSYPIHIGSGLLDRAGEVLASAVGRRAVIVTNATVAVHYLAPVRAGMAKHGVETDVVMVPDGEAHKSWPALQDIVTRLLDLRIDRGTTLIALGGGVI